MYKKHTWAKGEKITSALLNNIENGIEQALNEIAELKAKLDEKKIEVKEVKAELCTDESPVSECEVDGNGVKSTTATSENNSKTATKTSKK